MRQSWILRVAAVVFALPMLVRQSTYPRRRLKVVREAPPFPIMAVFVVLGSVVTFAMLVSIAAGHQYGAAIYNTGLTAVFFTVVSGLVTALDIILRQQIDLSGD